MDSSPLPIFDISRTDDVNWLMQLLSDLATDECCSEDDRAKIRDAINDRVKFLNKSKQS